MEEATDNSVVSYGDWYIKEAPRHLDDIYGQEAIVKALKKQMKERNFSKAYFFSGQFGSGKTAIAKILAASIASRQLDENGEALESSPTFQTIMEEKWARDVVYFNAEDMSAQDIRDQVTRVLAFPASRDAAKVVICDEAQALSKEAVEAFLEATQSPKKNIFFVFTAMNKLQGPKAGALQSRCKQWKMKVPTFDEVYLYLADFAKKHDLLKNEKVPRKFWAEGLKFIAENSEYSYRKALQLFQQCYEAELFEVSEIKSTLNIISNDDASKMLISIASGNIDQNVWDSVTGKDYLEKLPLLILCIGEAQTYRTFGDKFIVPEEKWKWENAKILSESPSFDIIRDTFMEFSKSSFTRRGEWETVISSLIEKCVKKPTEKIATRSRVPVKDAN